MSHSSRHVIVFAKASRAGQRAARVLPPPTTRLTKAAVA